MQMVFRKNFLKKGNMDSRLTSLTAFFRKKEIGDVGSILENNQEYEAQ